MKSVELMQCTEDKVSLRTLRDLKNIAVHSAGAGEGRAFIVASVHGEEDAATAAGALYALIADALYDKGMEIVHERIFGSVSVEAAVLHERNAALSERQIPADGPVTYVEGNPPWGEGLAGIIIHAVSSDGADDVWTIMDGEDPCGRGWRRNGQTYLVLQNVQGIDGHSWSPHLSNGSNAPNPPLKVRGGEGKSMYETGCRFVILSGAKDLYGRSQ